MFSILALSSLPTLAWISFGRNISYWYIFKRHMPLLFTLTNIPRIFQYMTSSVLYQDLILYLKRIEAYGKKKKPRYTCLPWALFLVQTPWNILKFCLIIINIILHIPFNFRNSILHYSVVYFGKVFINDLDVGLKCVIE